METDKSDVDESSGDSGGWGRLAESVREARRSLGLTSRAALSQACGVSVRVLADLESGSRDNFSDRVLSSVETGLGWPAGTALRVVSDPDFTAPAPVVADDLMFRPPSFDRKPVGVPVAVIEQLIAALASAEQHPGRLPAAAVGACWPYIVRLVEDNCLPGAELHPSVRPVYAAFAAVADKFDPDCADSRYARWLAGDEDPGSEQVTDRYRQRLRASRRTTFADPPADGG